MQNITKKLSESRLMRFFMGGGMMVIFSFAFNYLFREIFGWPVRIAYLFTMIIDFSLGFAINRHFVFKRQAYSKNSSKMFVEFIVWGLAFRLTNWLIYILLVEKMQFAPFAAQGTAITILLGIKYLTYHRVFK